MKMKLVEKIKTLMTVESKSEEKISHIKTKLDSVVMYCSSFDMDIDRDINILLYLDFDETQVSILDLVRYGTYFNKSHIFMTTFKNLVNLRMNHKDSEIVKQLFANISSPSCIDRIADESLDKEEIELTILEILDYYEGYMNNRYYLDCGLIDFPQIDELLYSIKEYRDIGDDYESFIPFRISLSEVPYYYLESIIKCGGYDVNIETYTKPYDSTDKTERYPFKFEGKVFNYTIEEAIYSIINMAISTNTRMSSILPQGIALNVDFTITLDRIFTYLDTSENEEFKTIFENIIISYIGEEVLTNRKYKSIKSDEELHESFTDNEYDDIWEEEYK